MDTRPVEIPRLKAVALGVNNAWHCQRSAWITQLSSWREADLLLTTVTCGATSLIQFQFLSILVTGQFSPRAAGYRVMYEPTNEIAFRIPQFAFVGRGARLAAAKPQDLHETMP